MATLTYQTPQVSEGEQGQYFLGAKKKGAPVSPNNEQDETKTKHGQNKEFGVGYLITPSVYGVK